MFQRFRHVAIKRREGVAVAKLSIAAAPPPTIKIVISSTRRQIRPNRAVTLPSVPAPRRRGRTCQMLRESVSGVLMFTRPRL